MFDHSNIYRVRRGWIVPLDTLLYVHVFKLTSVAVMVLMVRALCRQPHIRTDDILMAAVMSASGVFVTIQWTVRLYRNLARLAAWFQGLRRQ